MSGPDGSGSTLGRQMVVLSDDTQLFTCSSDGTLALWSIADPEGRLSKRERVVPYSEEILVSKTELDVSHPDISPTARHLQ